jgi:hypothetical protein
MDSGRVRWWTVDSTAGPLAYTGPLRRQMPLSEWEAHRERRERAGHIGWAEAWEPVPRAERAAQRQRAHAQHVPPPYEPPYPQQQQQQPAGGGRARASGANEGSSLGAGAGGMEGLHLGSDNTQPQEAGELTRPDEAEEEEYMRQRIRPLETPLQFTHRAQTHRPPPPDAIVDPAAAQ